MFFTTQIQRLVVYHVEMEHFQIHQAGPTKNLKTTGVQHTHIADQVFLSLGFWLLYSCFLESHLFLYFHTWVIVTDDVLVRKGNATHDTFCKFEQQLALMRYFTKISQDIDEISKNISGHIQSCTAMVRKILSNVFSMFHAKPWHWSLLQGRPISYL